MATPPAQKVHITPEGARRLQEELDRLWRVERPRVTREVAAAAALGDRSENAEYIYGKKRLREIDRRIEFLRKRFDVLVVVQPGEVARDRVYFGAWVTLEDEDGAELRYRLVGPDESDVASGAISIESPIGRVLVGKRTGDEVTVERPAGRARFTVLEIRYEAG
ncbi:MAG TPA: transcription elongation factor GreB [Myxococcota bacterium]|nr:transcription elongation factor GreB [Myxococcota bacterium]